MTNQHPITPPPELVEKWHDDWLKAKVLKANVKHVNFDEYISTKAARWGADQELEACCEYLTRCAAWEPEDVQEMLDLRRPKPPSLKEQAHEALGRFFSNAHTQASQMTQDFEIICRAVEQLND